MLYFHSYDISTLLLLLFLALAVIKDLRRHRIPNLITFGALFTGLSLQLFFIGSDGLIVGLKGAGLALVALLPFYLTGGMGAGDVKLMAAVGAFIGPSAAFQAACFSLVVGGSVALFFIFRSGELKDIYRRYAVMVAARTFVPAEPGSVVRYRFPFSTAIATGTIVQQGLSGKLGFYHLSTQITYQLQAFGVIQ